MSAAIIPFTGQVFPIYKPSRELIAWRGREVEKWVVLVRDPDGSENWHGPLKTKSDAVWLAGELAEGDRKKRAREASELEDVRAFLSLPQAKRDAEKKRWRAEGFLPLEKA